MKILFYSHFFKPETGAGSIRAQYLVRVLREFGFIVDVISPHPNYPQKAKYEKLPKMVYYDKNLNVTYLPIYIPKNDSLHNRFLSYFSYTIFSFFYSILFMKKYDVIISSSPPIFTSFAAFLVAKIKRTKFIWDMRDFWPEIGIELGILKNPFMIKSISFLESVMLKNSDHLVVTSNGSKNHLIQCGVKEQSICVAYNGADTDIFKIIAKEKKEDIIKKYGLKSDRLLFTYFGSFNSGMNDIFILAESLIKLSEIKSKFQFLIIGDGYNKSEFLKVISGKVDYIDLGSQNILQTAEVVSCCDLSLIPRKSLKKDLGGNIPVKCFESWASGVPVLLSSDENTEIASIISECKAGFLVNTNSVDDFSTKIKEIIFSNFNLTEMGILGRNYVAKYYDRKVHARKLIDVISKLSR